MSSVSHPLHSPCPLMQLECIISIKFRSFLFECVPYAARCQRAYQSHSIPSSRRESMCDDGGDHHPLTDTGHHGVGCRVPAATNDVCRQVQTNPPPGADGADQGDQPGAARLVGAGMPSPAHRKTSR